MTPTTGDNIGRVSREGLCVSCLTCVAACPSGAIMYGTVFGLRRPVVSEAACTHCGRCATVCPAIHLPGAEESSPPALAWLVGDVLGAYVASAADDQVRSNAVSGGIATTLLLSALAQPATRVFATRYAGAPGEDPDLVELRDRADVLAAAGSRYAPVGIEALLDAFQADTESRFVVVATPCVLDAILRFLRLRRIPRGRLLAIGLVCDRAMSPRAVSFLADRYAPSGSTVSQTAYRTKLVGGWPGGVRLTTSDGRTIDLDRSARGQLKPFYQMRRCTTCADKLNREADIVLGDCYIAGLEDPRGRSTVLVRTQAGQAALDVLGAQVDLMAVSVADVATSQVVSGKLPSLDRAIVVAEIIGLPRGRTLTARRTREARREISAAWWSITRAETADFGAVAQAIGWWRLRARARRLASRIEIVLAALWTGVRSFGKPVAPLVATDVRDVVVTGAGFGNRGAQAMLFAVLDGVHEAFPEARVHMAYPTPIEGAEERYQVTLLPWDAARKARLAGWPLSRRAEEHFSAWEGGPDASAVLSESACVLDVSGFKLSSEFGLAESLDFCTNVLVARVLGVPYVVMPQSIGPLDYSLGVGLLLRPLVRRALASATLLWAREPGALATAQQHRGAQARLAPDIVLAHRDRRPERIYRAGHGPRIVDVPEHFACVIPSGHILKRRGADGFDEFYSAAVRRVLSSGREVLLLPHSAHDLALCARIAGIVADERVTVAAHDLDAIELESVIGRADFVVASRYHSLVHAYRQAVPAVVVGWAEKYEAVAALVGQERFVFPVDVDVATALSAIDELSSHHAEESARIRERVAAGFTDAVREVVDTLADR